MELVEPIRDRNQIEAMKLVLKADNLRNWCLFILGINSGLRISDLLKITISDVVSKQGKIKERIKIREKKTGKTKDFPLSDTCRKAIWEYLSERKPKLSEPLFLSQKRNLFLSRVRAYQIINKAAKAVGIKDNVGTHTLRKTFGYQAYKSGKDLSIIQKLLNHSSQSETLRYIGITKDDLDDVYRNLNL